MIRLILPALLCAVSVGASRVDADESIDFQADVHPILSAHCLDCHGQEEQEAGLRLDDRASLLRVGERGSRILVPGKPKESLLIQAVRGDQADFRMPPQGRPLTDAQIVTLSRWIQQGADWPGQMELDGDSVTTDHWSFQPPNLVPPPHAPDSITNPIDRFVLARLAEHGMKLAMPADSVTLIRRVSLVLTGLPPSPQRVAQIAGSESFDDEYIRFVDQLLDSPGYGERWAQHWLDVIRWAETVGFETNLARPNAWPYRDWVIGSLNEDKPYDQFVFEQIAGDTVGQDAALGFLVAGPANLPGQIGRDEEAMRQARQDELDEVIRTVSQALFGLTVGCARCHNHKFDPILQRDYYSMQAIFAGLTYGDRRWRGEENDRWNAKLPEARKKVHSAVALVQSLQQKHHLLPPVTDLQTESFEAVEATAVRMTIDATNTNAAASLYELQAWSAASETAESRNVALASAAAQPSASSFALANQTRHFDNLVDGSSDRRQAFPWVATNAGPAWIQVDFADAVTIDRIVWDRGSSVPVDYKIEVQATAGKWISVADTTRRMPRVDDVRPAENVSIDGLSADAVREIVDANGQLRAAQAELSRLSAGPQVYAARFDESPAQTWLLRRGDPMQRTQQLEPAIPLVLGKMEYRRKQDEKARRLALARHLTDPRHPLTARVAVNRVWQHHFGRGLVDSPSDFGKMGSPPSHPLLLDWLAKDFAGNGWSLKRLHRMIVTSMTFRQSSRPQADCIAVDADTRLLWRFPPRRLEAEGIRDSILFVSGKLNRKMGGPGFDLFRQRGGLSDYTPIETFDENGWRRMIYAHKIRMQAVDIFGAFDCPDAGQMKPKRTRSVTPIQSLSLMNSPFVYRQAEFFADRIKQEHGDDVKAQIDAAYQFAYSRSPRPAELKAVLPLVNEYGLQQLCRVLFNTSEFLYIQ